MEVTGLAVLAAVAVLVALHMPLALSLILPGAIGLVVLGAGGQIPDQLWALLAAPDLVAVPLVLFLGNLAFYGGYATQLHDAAAVLLQHRRGGLALAAILGCAGFAATSGSSVACAATMGRIAVPAMGQAGYDLRLAGSSVAIGSTLGALLPPSMLLILWSLLTGTPLAQMFMGALLPAALSLAGMVATVLWWVRRDLEAGPPAQILQVPRGAAIRAAWPAPVLLAILLGGIGFGLLSPAAALGLCAAVTLANALGNGRLTGETLLSVLRDTVLQAATTLLMLAGARLVLAALDLAGLPGMLAVDAGTVPLLAAVMVLGLACVVLGLLAEPALILILALPFALGIGAAHGLGPVWSGIVLIKLVEIALILPPLGLNAVIVATATRIWPQAVFAGLGRFLFLDLLVLTALAMFPALT
jgi:C4-dicarboxylate transporter, DctM subunit